MNCDYEIHFQGRIFYIELAGMLENTKHQECYKNNISINSKSKEKYRLDLIKKKTILEKENLEYYILLKSEMNEDTYKNILNNSYKEVA
jgi:transcription antitermination factor NusG